MAKNISILGSTGSIGVQTLDVIKESLAGVKVFGLSAHNNVALLKKQIKIFKPRAVSIDSYDNAVEVKNWCKQNKFKVSVFEGAEGLNKIATLSGVDTVVSSVVGAAGLVPLVEAICARKNIAIANKEALVMAGPVITKLVKQYKVSLLPVDSEHSAVFQCLSAERLSEVKKIILTASGGPFYKYNKNFSNITVEQALAHPTWIMGKKITIDSATLMNKGLEAIEASVLFGLPIDNVDIVIHPQSIVHSMVEYTDGSVIAQMSVPDMRLPIQYALTYPRRLACRVKPLNLAEVSRLDFYKPDFAKFSALNLAYAAARTGYTMPAVLNGSNEAAVTAFLNKQIKFTDIALTVQKVTKRHKVNKNLTLESVLEADAWARKEAALIINRG
ncbi:MAG: 1-deoxy-D-xylulose-5-phosphate reductoisomerase [Elusimicrobia bacterium]|nr:1-deoxy-D-xylulose-5-phosphate reductoisomerase [Elusimicrobiota bacterium]